MLVKSMILKDKSALLRPLPQGERDSLPEAAGACASSYAVAAKAPRPWGLL